MVDRVFSSMGGHHSARPRTEDWLTPPHIIEALGGAESFDLDPCASMAMPWPTAKRMLTVEDNGLTQEWVGRIWMNPPYSSGVIGVWLARIAAHGTGTALIFARTETNAFFDHVWDQASAVLFLRGRLNFHLPDGRRAGKNAGAPSVLCAYGPGDADMLSACGIPGQFVPITLPRIFAIALRRETWREALAEWMAAQRGPVALADIYRAFARHPKARGNRNYPAKIRQQLQLGDFERHGRGLWSAA
tara:strand:+ start:18408 stop:19145 length:738 start_codon:yes stop_codon:yes gene_type:complete